MNMLGQNKKTILIVDDEPSHLMVLTDTLMSEGFLIFAAKNGQEGLEIALREQPDLIFLDRVLPVMDGMTTMKKIRESGLWGKSVPIILLTNLSASKEDKDMLKALGYDMEDYLVKSDYKLTDIVKKVKKKLDQ